VCSISEENKRLLEAADWEIVPTEPDPSQKFRLLVSKELFPRGVQSLLAANATNSDDVTEQLRSRLLGQRVAIRSGSANGNEEPFLGTIINVIRKGSLDEDYFSVFYDGNAAIDDLKINKIHGTFL